MTDKEAIKQIEKYLSSDSHQPMVVDISSIAQMQVLKRQFDVKGRNTFISTCRFCNEGDSMPLLDKLKHIISKERSNVFLTDLSTYLKLQGEEYLKLQIKSFLTDTLVQGKLVIFTYKCREYLNLPDKRLLDSRRIIFVDSEIQTHKNRIFFVSSKLPFDFNSVDIYADGISKLSTLIETSYSEDVFVKTNFQKKDFAASIFDIRDVASSYDIIMSFCEQLKDINRISGTEEQWGELLSLLQKENFSWINIVHKRIGYEIDLANCLHKFKNYSNFDKWILFLALKCYGCNNNNYLTLVVGKSYNLEQFEQELYNCILKIEYTDDNFKNIYSERKLLLSDLPHNSDALISYTKKVESKGVIGIYYLTDITKIERELILKLIGPFSQEFDRRTTEQVIKCVYNSLYSYLSPYNYGERYNEYFDLYKYGKITNIINDRFAQITEEHVVEKIFLQEPSRAYLVEKINKKNCFLYFVDAMGVEFLSYIQHLCYANGLEFKADIGVCNLPSITTYNKEFVLDFINAGCQYSDIKSLDEIKHSGELDYNYEKVKEPIYVSDELSIFDELISKINHQLQQGNLEKVVLIADHGASRMAVLSDSENKWEMINKGQHSGRCCPISDLDSAPESSIEENGFWCLLNYDRFKGGRRANVEVHGGASIEEILVPIIEITKKKQIIECAVDDNYKIITSSFRKSAKIKLYISKTYDNVCIILNGAYYAACKEDGKDYIYDIEMLDLRKPGIYEFDVLANNNIIARGLNFELKNEGASERKFF